MASFRCSLRARSLVVMALCGVMLCCGGKKEDGDEDGEEDVGEDLASEVDAEDDAPEDVPEDGSGDVEDEEVVDPCPTPGLHLGSVVDVSDPGGEIGGDGGRGASLAFGGGVMGLGWSDGREEELSVTNEEIYMQILDPDGTLVGTEVQVSDMALESKPPSVVWTDDRFAALWGDDRAFPAGNVFLGAVDTTGNPVGTETQVTTDGVSGMFVSAVWTGSRIGVAWTDNKDATMDVYFALVQTDGTLDGSITRVSDAAGNSFNPRVAWSGTSFFIVWADTMGGEIWEFRIYMSILDSSGSVTSGPTMISPADSDAKMPVVAWSDGVLAACWDDFRDGGHDMYCAGYDGTGAEAVSAAPVASLGGNQPSAILSGSLVPTPDGFALAWADENGVPGEDEVYFVILSPSLEVSGPDTALTENDGEITAVSLAVTSTGVGYGVAWVVDDGAAEGEDTLHYLGFSYCE